MDIHHRLFDHHLTYIFHSVLCFISANGFTLAVKTFRNLVRSFLLCCFLRSNILVSLVLIVFSYSAIISGISFHEILFFRRTFLPFIFQKLMTFYILCLKKEKRKRKNAFAFINFFFFYFYICTFLLTIRAPAISSFIFFWRIQGMKLTDWFLFKSWTWLSNLPICHMEELKNLVLFNCLK